jgi:hypothetical protein
MEERNQQGSSTPNEDQANYNPTARNFDQTDVSGKSEPINSVNQETSGRENEKNVEDSDPPLTELDLEETGLSEEDADKIEWDSPQEQSGQPKGPGK